jgi:hypothetical protein
VNGSGVNESGVNESGVNGVVGEGCGVNVGGLTSQSGTWSLTAARLLYPHEWHRAAIDKTIVPMNIGNRTIDIHLKDFHFGLDISFIEFVSVSAGNQVGNTARKTKKGNRIVLMRMHRMRARTRKKRHQPP